MVTEHDGKPPHRGIFEFGACIRQHRSARRNQAAIPHAARQEEQRSDSADIHARMQRQDTPLPLPPHHSRGDLLSEASEVKLGIRGQERSHAAAA